MSVCRKPLTRFQSTSTSTMPWSRESRSVHNPSLQINQRCKWTIIPSEALRSLTWCMNSVSADLEYRPVKTEPWTMLIKVSEMNLWGRLRIESDMQIIHNIPKPRTYHVLFIGRGSWRWIAKSWSAGKKGHSCASAWKLNCPNQGISMFVIESFSSLHTK